MKTRIPKPKTDIDYSIDNLNAAVKKLREVRKKKSYSEAEIRTIRTLILQTVRNNLDPLIGHMPFARSY